MSLNAPDILPKFGTTMAPVRPNAALFAKNLHALKPHIGAQLHARLAQLHKKRKFQSRIVGDPTSGPMQGTLNIDLGRIRLYNTDAENYARRQVDSFLRKPYRFKLPIIIPDKSQMPRLNDMALTLSNWADQAELEDIQYKDAGHLVSVGLGLGLHIPRLLSVLPVRNLVIVEPVLEFVYHTLSILPWRRIVRHFERIGGGINIHVNEDGHLLGSELVNSLRENHFAELDGSYFLQHYKSDVLAQTVESLNEQAGLLKAVYGFFEDECVMTRNSMANIRRWPHRFLEGSIPPEKLGMPLILIGSGPSIDRSIDKLREIQDKAVLMTCGTGIGTILRAGIKPDFHCEMENTIYVSMALNTIYEEHSFDGITLVGPNTLQPDVAGLFHDRILFYRDGVAPTRLLHGESSMKLATPSVANTGFRAALSMGFTEFYLFGMDLGSKDREQHHSENSIYKKGVERWTAISGEVRLPVKVTSNHGGAFYTSATYLMTRMFLEKLIALADVRGVYNTGDGIEIKGASPLAIDDVSLPTPGEDKQETLKRCVQALPHIEADQFFDAKTLREMNHQFDKNMDYVRRILENEELPLHTVIAKLYPALHQKERDDGNRPATTARFIGTGTLTAGMQMAYFVFRRLEDPAKLAEFSSLWRRLMLELVDGMKSDLDTLVRDIGGEDTPKTHSGDGSRPQPAA